MTWRFKPEEDGSTRRKTTHLKLGRHLLIVALASVVRESNQRGPDGFAVGKHTSTSPLVEM